MPCCGQSRAAAAAAATTATLTIPPPTAPARVAQTDDAPPAPAPSTPPPPSSVRVRYAHDRAVRVRGPVSARDYAFSGTDAVQSVDSRDAEGLVGTGLFRRVY